MDNQDDMLVLGDITEKIVNIWKDVLGKGDIDMNDHFLDLGGDSLDAMRCAVRLQREFGIELSLYDFFMEDATVIGMAKIVRAETQSLDVRE